MNVSTITPLATQPPITVRIELNRNEAEALFALCGSMTVGENNSVVSKNPHGYKEFDKGEIIRSASDVVGTLATPLYLALAKVL